MSPEICPSHEAFKEQLLAALISVKEIVRTEIQGLRDDFNRRFEESLEDRQRLHEKTNALGIEVGKAMARLNGAQLHAHAHKRDDEQPPREQARTDDKESWIQRNWLVIVALLLGIFAGERVLPWLARVLGVAP